MKRKLQIGDKVRWNLTIGGGDVYTILDIDTSRPTVTVGNHALKNEVLFQWDQDGQIIQTWSHDYQKMNELVDLGHIIILNPKMEPNKYLKKFKL